MKIKVFYQQSKEKLVDFEARVNDFIADKKVIDIKYQEAMTGDYENLTTLLSLLVMYNETN
ncbi:sporulation protein Cse60 [Streptococcus dysgalactiae subsp. dysgalactiae]|nr:sporulation protein Cse60 [Streptococcus dysgalactiae]QGG97838.1 sporulation protein Cse60 [Streptococcus dysgalactiae subsp. dysgalactiae]